MESNQSNLLYSEMLNGSAYIERLFKALIEVTALYHRQDALKITETFSEDVFNFVKDHLIANSLFEAKQICPSAKETRSQIKAAFELCKSLSSVGKLKSDAAILLVDFLNMTYEHAQQLHQFIDDNSVIEVFYPQLNILKMIEHDEFDSQLNANIDESKTVFEVEENNAFSIPQFYLPVSSILEIEKSNSANISSLETKRTVAVDDNIKLGHEAAQKKEYTKSLEYFQKALSLKETAKTITLVGWGYGLLKKWEMAKSYCLKAIRLDPDYGPAYNDLGTYLLSQGQITESLKWFDLSKKALKFENKEFPFINAGRAYMMQKKYPQALTEFNHALEISPFHFELKKTVERLKSSLKKNNAQKETPIKANEGFQLPPSVF